MHKQVFAVVVVMGNFQSSLGHCRLSLKLGSVCERAMLVLLAGARKTVPAAELERCRYGV